MARIQEYVNLGSETDNVISVIVRTVSQLDWIIQEFEIGMVSFREKRRFDHFNHVEGKITIENNHDQTELHIDLRNNGIGTIQEEYLRGKFTDLDLLLKENIEEERSLSESKRGTGEGTLAHDIQGLSELHQKGELSDEEFKIAKMKLLEGNECD